MNAENILGFLWACIATVCFTILFSKGCDYGHTQAMKQIECTQDVK